MALTIADATNIPGGDPVGRLRAVVLTVTFDASYPTGGESLTAAEIGYPAATVRYCLVHPSAGFVFEYDYTNAKVKAYWVDTTVDGAPMAEVTATTDLSAVATRAYALVEGV